MLRSTSTFPFPNRTRPCGASRSCCALDRMVPMATDSPHRPSPDQLLAEVEREEVRQRRGRLKVFLGYASGVGKSFQMLDEGRRRHERGEDVVVCAVQPEYPAEIQPILQ